MAILSAAALAFDTVAPHFDTRFGGWQSVAAQRRGRAAEADRASLIVEPLDGGRTVERHVARGAGCGAGLLLLNLVLRTGR